VADPVLELVVGPNGAGKSTFFGAVIEPTTQMQFVNADMIAAEEWPDEAEARSYEASKIAGGKRQALIDGRESFATETVFSHVDKLSLVRSARAAGYIVNLRVILVSEDTAVSRVEERVLHRDGTGHAVGEEKIRSRYKRLWAHVAEAIALSSTARVYDNSSPTAPYRLVATFREGELVDSAPLPAWTPGELAATINPVKRGTTKHR
jgi:predicted ABC-type ATPase